MDIMNNTDIKEEPFSEEPTVLTRANQPETAEDHAIASGIFDEPDVPAITFTNHDQGFLGSSGASTISFGPAHPKAYTLNDQLRIQEDGRIIVSTELKASMDELAEEFWRQVTKRFPITSGGKEQISDMIEGVQAAIDACETCEDASCSACEILETVLINNTEPEIQEIQEGQEEGQNYNIVYTHDEANKLQITTAGNVGLGTNPDGTVDIANTEITKENTNDRTISAEPTGGERDKE